MPWDHTVLLATRQRCESRLYPQPKQILDLATPEGCKAELPILLESGPAGLGFELRTCQSQVRRPTAAPTRRRLVFLWPLDRLKDVFVLTSYLSVLIFVAVHQLIFQIGAILASY